MHEPREVSVSEARAQLKDILDAAARGESTVIVDRKRCGKKLAVVVGYQTAREAAVRDDTAA